MSSSNLLPSNLPRQCSTAVADPSGRSPLHLGAQQGGAGVVAALLQARADLAARCPSTGAQPLHLAAARGHTAVVELLLEAGAGVEARDRQGQTPLMKAAAQGHHQTARALVTAGARPDAQDYGGHTALLLHCSSTNPQPALISLLSCTMSVSRPCHRGRTPVTEVLVLPGPSRLAALLALVRAGAHLAGPGPLGLSPLHLAITARDTQSAAVLIRAGAPVDNQDGLALALERGQFEVADMMVRAGAPLTPLPSMPPWARAWVLTKRCQVSSLRVLARQVVRRALGTGLLATSREIGLPATLARDLVMLID